jgi:hypothetical protein
MVHVSSEVVAMTKSDGSIEHFLVPQAATLDGWAAQKWEGGVQIDELRELDTLSVETMHHTYEITIINPSTAEVLIRGGERFPQRTEAKVLGASMGRSFLKQFGIYVGLRMELMADGGRIITSRVRRIDLVHAGEAPAFHCIDENFVRPPFPT